MSDSPGLTPSPGRSRLRGATAAAGGGRRRSKTLHHSKLEHEMRYLRLAFEAIGTLAILSIAWSIWSPAKNRYVVFPPHFILSHDFDQGSLLVQGTWSLEDEEIAWPAQSTTIRCERKSGTCFEATSVIAKDFMMPIDINLLQIKRWDRQMIIIEGAISACNREIYQILLATNMVSGLVERREDASPALCSLLSKNNRRMRMIDGYKAASEARYGKRLN